MSGASSKFKGVPSKAAVFPIEKIGTIGLRLGDDELMLPAAILKESALAGNSRWMMRFVNENGLSLAPHGKTTMSPQLIRRQLADGAWAITAATAHHARLYASWGVRRILMANQLVGAANVEAVVALLGDDPDLEFYALVDSAEGACRLAEAWTKGGAVRPLFLLLELGGEGERTGVRTSGDALAVARACAQYPAALSLRGVECFEGVYGDVESARRLLGRLSEALELLESEQLLAGCETIVSAGGTAFFDEAARAMLAISTGRPLRLVLRSGCYLVHDSEHYERCFDASASRCPSIAERGRLRPALEVWAHAQSRPEPSRLVASLGKRDIGHDVHPPVLLWTLRPGVDKTPRPVPDGVRVAKLFDQHICLDIPPDFDVAVGDLLGFGQSHPCTTFDKWRALFVVDDDYRVIDMIRTYF